MSDDEEGRRLEKGRGRENRWRKELERGDKIICKTQEIKINDEINWLIMSRNKLKASRVSEEQERGGWSDEAYSQSGVKTKRF